MKKINSNWYFGFAILLVLITGIILIVLTEPATTGQSIKSQTLQKYKGCSYLSHDKYGECYIVERQNQAHCDPRDGTLLPEVAIYKRSWDRRATGWYYRPCSNVRYNG